MSGYILSVLGIVLTGIVIDIIIPTGEINKYIKSVYSIFVVAVLIMPVVNFFKDKSNYNFSYTSYEINENLINFIYRSKVEEKEKEIEIELESEGFNKVDIKLNYSFSSDILTYNSCIVNLENLEISTDKQHINKYEFIDEIVFKHTNLSKEVIVFNE